MFSRFFINRPIFATVVSLFFVLAGLISLQVLPIAEFPDIVPPEVQVSARYPGASAETIAQTVAAPIEQKINGVENMIYMRSVSAGRRQPGHLTVSFESRHRPRPEHLQRQQPRAGRRVVPARGSPPPGRHRQARSRRACSWSWPWEARTTATTRWTSETTRWSTSSRVEASARRRRRRGLRLAATTPSASGCARQAGHLGLTPTTWAPHAVSEPERPVRRGRHRQRAPAEPVEMTYTVDHPGPHDGPRAIRITSSCAPTTTAASCAWAT